MVSDVLSKLTGDVEIFRRADGRLLASATDLFIDNSNDHPKGEMP